MLPAVGRHAGSAVPCIANVAHVIDDQGNDGARAAPIDVSHFKLLAFGKFKKQLLSLLKTVLDGLDRLFGKVLVLDDELVQVVAKEVSADVPPVPVIDTEEGALGPFCTAVLLRLGLHYVEYDGNSVLVVVSDDSLVRVRSVCGDNAVSFGTVLGGLIVRHQLLDVLNSARAYLLPYTLVKIFANHSLRVRAVVVTLGPLDTVFDYTGRRLLERGRLKALLRVEETSCALPSSSIPTETVRVNTAKVPGSLITNSWRLERCRPG